MSTNTAKTSGVQELVDRLRMDGVDEGRKEAESLLEVARRKAAQIVEDAESEAIKTRKQADDASRRMQKSAEEALRLAVRDSLLRLRTEIEDRFAAQMEQMVSQRLEDPEFLERLLLSVAGQAVPRDKSIEVLLPEAISQASADMEHAHHAEVDAFVRGMTGDMLREGVTISVSSDHEAGLVVRVAEAGFEVRLDDRSLSQLLGQHLLPRFRALLDGDSIGTEQRNDRE